MRAFLGKRPLAIVLFLVFGASCVDEYALAAVGTTTADYGVTPNGEALYSVPIQVTEGINGLTPRLAISYVGPNSRSILGISFALSGLSYVTPCRKTIAQDLSAAPVTLTSTDRYCLDGAKLRLVAGTGTYGQSESRYRTELDRLIRVTAKSSVNGIPGWFKVELPNGLEYEYGNSTNSKLLASGAGGAPPQFWAVNKISDPYGNAIVFEYVKDDSLRIFRPNYISYTERGGSGHYRITFVYQTPVLTEPTMEYTPSNAGGAAHSDDRLLERIDLSHDLSVYRKVNFTYQTGSGNNWRLNTIQECIPSVPDDCLAPIQLTWQSATAGHDLPVTNSAVSSNAKTLDINGDGIEDLVWDSGGTWRYMLGSAVGFGTVINTAVAATNPSKAMALEWNGDGFDDLLIDWSDGKWRVLTGSSNGLATSQVHAGSGAGISSGAANIRWTVVDSNRDGRDDLLYIATSSSPTISVLLKIHLNTSSGYGAATTAYTTTMLRALDPGISNPTAASSVRRPDFNGDGRTDLVIYSCEWDAEPPGTCLTVGWYLLMSNGTTYTNVGNLLFATLTTLRYGDFNRDGLTDVVYPAQSPNKWYVGFGQGSGNLNTKAGPSLTGYATYMGLVGDHDGDGYDDFYASTSSSPQWHVFRGTASGIALSPLTPGTSAVGNGWVLVDQTGDGLADIGSFDTGTLNWRSAAHLGLAGERLLSATDGLGSAVAFSYLPMTDNSVYAKGTGATYPDRDVEFSSPLVRTMQVSPAGGTSYTITYKYANARFHGQGRSFLGMGQREITDGRNGIYGIDTYRQDFPYIGVPATSIVYQHFESTPSALKPIQSAAYSYDSHVLDSTAGNERYLPYRSQTLTNGYEVEGVRNGDLVSEITETQTVNTFGNSTFISINIKDKDGSSPEMGLSYRTEFTSTYVENTTDWCIGLPLTRDVKRTLADGSFRTHSASWQVSTAECHVTQQTREPGEGSLVSLVTDVGHDACGNVNSMTSYPVGQTSQSRVTTVDYGVRCQQPEVVTNPEGHQSRLEYLWSLALPSAYIDPNYFSEPTPKKTQFEYDSFGRLAREIRPDDTGVRYALAACNSGNSWCGKNTSARVKVTRTERSNTDSVLRTDEQFLDGIGRTRWSHSDSLESGPTIIETIYDALDQPTARTQPYFAGSPVYSTSYQYDLVGRIKLVDMPISEVAPSGRTTVFKYEGRNLTVTDPANQVTAYRSDVLGELRAITDPGTGGITEFAYHPFGEMASIKDANGNLTSFTVNDRGFVIGTSDPDSGNWTFEVTAFGETAKIRDAKTTPPLWTTQFTFDKLSRPLTRVEAEGTTNFVWGNASHNSTTNKYIGHLKSVSSPAGYSELRRFDANARLDQLRTTIEGVNYFVDLQYDAFSGLVSSLQYPTSTAAYRHQINFSYQNNLLRSVSETGGAQTAYWSGNSTDAWGHYQDEIFGNGVISVTDFDQASGHMASREAGIGGGTGLINSLVRWDDLRDNFTERQDLKLTPTVTESFTNDALSRIDQSTRNGSQNFDVSLDAIGNIATKDGQTYIYSGNQPGCTYYAHSQPRAVRKIGTTIYCYDENGNMTKRGGSTINYASFNLPTVINSGSNSSTISYGAFRNRYKQIAVSSGTTETTIYVAGIFEKVTRPSGVVEYRHYIPGSQATSSILTRRTSGGNSTYYLHPDHLGSPELFTDSAGLALVRPSFSTYGERRDGSDWSGPPSAGDLTTIGNITRRGFTGHEHLDSVGLIHMNGRVYDPAAGRFLSVDPIIDIGLSQSPNSYSYVWNLPTTYVDPTGLDPDDGCEDDRAHPEKQCGTPDHPPPPCLRCGPYPGPVPPGPVGPPAPPTRPQPLADEWKQSFWNAVPGAYYAGQSQLAWQDGQYVSSVILGVGSLADAALGVATLGEASLATSTLRTASTVATREATFVDKVIPGAFGRASAGAGQVVRVLQTGGNKILQRTADELNAALGKSLPRRDWGRALESLKERLHLPNDHHGKILSTGDYVDEAGEVLGNLLDEIP